MYVYLGLCSCWTFGSVCSKWFTDIVQDCLTLKDWTDRQIKCLCLNMLTDIIIIIITIIV